jgi:hypothetical protein
MICEAPSHVVIMKQADVAKLYLLQRPRALGCAVFFNGEAQSEQRIPERLTAARRAAATDLTLTGILALHRL